MTLPRCTSQVDGMLFQPRYTAICEVKDMRTVRRTISRRSSSRQPADIPFKLQLLSCCDCSCRFDRLHFTPIHWHCYYKPVKIPTKKETKQRSRNSSMFEPAWFALLRRYTSISDRKKILENKLRHFQKSEYLFLMWSCWLSVDTHCVDINALTLLSCLYCQYRSTAS